MNNYEQTIFPKIKDMSDKYKSNLYQKMCARRIEMDSDDNSHYLIYNVLGVSSYDGYQIDLYQNQGRFLYRSAGSFLEEATLECFKTAFPSSEKIKIPNPYSNRKPQTFEIDCLVGDTAYEIKWRDATTDGDHIRKEHDRVKAIEYYGYKPVRIMFYQPNRKQSIKVQEKLKELYLSVNGEYYSGSSAWEYIHRVTNINLLKILEMISSEK